MNRLLSTPIDRSKAQKIYWVALILFCVLPVLLNTFLLVPLYTYLEADVVYKDSMLTIIIDYTQDLFDLCAFSVSYALIIFSMLLLTGLQTRLTVMLYAVLFFAQIPVKLFVINPIMYGSIGSITEIIIDVIHLTVYFALQMLQLLVVYLFSRTDSGRYKQYVDSLGSSKQSSQSAPKKILPFSKIFNWNNPLQRSAAKMSMLILGIKIFTRIVNDITYGVPESLGEVLIMCVYYISDIIYGVVAYLIAVCVISAVYEKLKSKDGDTLRPEKEQL